MTADATRTGPPAGPADDSGAADGPDGPDGFDTAGAAPAARPKPRGRAAFPGRTLTRFGRAVHAEAVRLGGRRGLLVRVALPLGIGLPLLITFAVAVVAERIAAAGGLFDVQQVDTDNSVYWIIYLGVTVFAVVAAYAQGTATHGPAAEVARHACPRALTGMLARWTVVGAVAAAGAWLAALFALIALPVAFPAVYGTVDLASSVGLRLLWALPLYALAACGIGIGIGALVPRPAAAVATVTLWSLLIENAMILMPGGANLVGWMPFLNGIYATGQDVALSPPWGRDGALVYVAAVAIVLIAAGWLRSRRKP